MNYLFNYFNKIIKFSSELLVLEIPDSLKNQKMIIISQENLEILYNSLFIKTTFTILSTLLLTYLCSIVTGTVLKKEETISLESESSDSESLDSDSDSECSESDREYLYSRGNRLRNLNRNSDPAIIPVEIEDSNKSGSSSSSSNFIM